MALNSFEAYWVTFQVIYDQEGLRDQMLANAAGYVSQAGQQGTDIPGLITVCKNNAAAYEVRLARQAAIPSATRTALLTFMGTWSSLGSDMVANFNALKAEADLEVTGAAALTDAASVIAFGNAIIARLPAHFRLW